MPKKQTQEEFIQKSQSIFGDQFDYSKVEYINSCTKIVITCPKHGDFEIEPARHISYKTACHLCKGIRNNIQTFLEKAIKVHGNKFDYSKSIFNVSIKEKIIIICKIHGEFNQAADKHINGQGCPKCKRSAHKDYNYVIEMGNKIYNNYYDYSKVIYIDMNTNIEIVCSKHGSFWQTPTNHITNKTKCNLCYRESTRSKKEDVIKQFFIVHGDRYNYSKIEYINSVTKIEIICNKHGSFWQTPHGHLSGNNCPKCTGSISIIEHEWLDYIKIDVNKRNKKITGATRYYRVDAYDPETNTIYEFYGDYWHGNPKIYDHSFINKHNKNRFKDLYDKTIKREKELKALGYNMITIWESDFKKILKENK